MLERSYESPNVTIGELGFRRCQTGFARADREAGRWNQTTWCARSTQTKHFTEPGRTHGQGLITSAPMSHFSFVIGSRGCSQVHCNIDSSSSLLHVLPDPSGGLRWLARTANVDDRTCESRWWEKSDSSPCRIAEGLLKLTQNQVHPVGKNPPPLGEALFQH